ncbi:unnamed protein product [Microthlaspi erraticum]|uniref:Uncharacterized protein n=1 Tax=Microthlaspi erraticum TaxID=1685480 RepID=A0A6D2HT26_9BRAS|nr:unnamed protein product [Microthlaspi erraticum]
MYILINYNTIHFFIFLRLLNLSFWNITTISVRAIIIVIIYCMVIDISSLFDVKNVGIVSVHHDVSLPPETFYLRSEHPLFPGFPLESLMVFFSLFPPVIRSPARSVQPYLVLAILLVGDSLSLMDISIGSMNLLRTELSFSSSIVPEMFDSSSTLSHLSVSHLLALPDLPPKPPDPPVIPCAQSSSSMHVFAHLSPETLRSK